MSDVAAILNLVQKQKELKQEIAKIIGDIQCETAQAVQAMDKSGKEVTEGVRVVVASKVAFEVIYSDVKNMRQKVEDIVVLVNKQESGSVQVEQAINSIADSARMNSNSSQEVAATSEEQNA